MKKTITLFTLDDSDGPLLPREEVLARQVKRLESKEGRPKDMSDEAATEIIGKIKSRIAKVQQFKAQNPDRVIASTYVIDSPTTNQDLEANEEASSIVGSQKFHDAKIYQKSLVGLCVEGLGSKTGGMKFHIIQELFLEIESLMYVSDDELLFFD